MYPGDATSTTIVVAVKRTAPLLITVMVVFCIGAVTLQQMTTSTGGRLVYTLDDAYIHLATASNLAGHGVMGITRHAFSSSTSSPLFTLLLAALVALFGRSEIHPLLLGVLAVPCILVVYDRLLASYEIGVMARLILLLVFVHMSGMLWLLFTGLEHLLHLLVALLLLMRWQQLDERRAGVDASLAFLALAVVMLRFESVFLVGAVSLMFVVARRPWSALLLVCVAVLPFLVYGLISHLNGGMFLSNSVVMKAVVPQGDGLSSIGHLLGYRVVLMAGRVWTYYIIPLLVVPGLLLSSLRTDRRMRVIFVLLAAWALHLLVLKEQGTIDRYVALLVALFTAYGGILAHSVVRDYPLTWMGRERVFVRIGLVLFFGMLVLPVHYEWKQRIEDVPIRSKNIADQQVQMGMFVRDFLPDTMAIAVNDIGAVSYFTKVPILDLYGIGDDEVTWAWYRGEFTTARMSELLRVRGVRLLMVYTDLFRGKRGLPHGLVPMGEWTIPNNVACRDDNVAFLATDSAAYRMIAPRFREYSEEWLPRDVTVVYDSVAGYGRTDALVRH